MSRPADAPRAKRSPKRYVDVAFRTAHVAAMAMLVGGAHFAAPAEAVQHWRLATVLTGVAILAVEASHSRHWIYQGRGVLALGHAALAAFVGFGGSHAAILALVVGAMGSHLPKHVRWWSFRHGRVLE